MPSWSGRLARRLRDGRASSPRVRSAPPSSSSLRSIATRNGSVGDRASRWKSAVYLALTVLSARISKSPRHTLLVHQSAVAFLADHAACRVIRIEGRRSPIDTQTIVFDLLKFGSELPRGVRHHEP